MNSMNAKRIALLGSPQMRQSMTVPQPAKKVARLSSVTCRTATTTHASTRRRQQHECAVCQISMTWGSAHAAPLALLAPHACAPDTQVHACMHARLHVYMSAPASMQQCAVQAAS